MKLLYLFFITLSICGCSNNKVLEKDDIIDIDTEAVFEMIEETDTYIIDVREEEEYHAGHIPGSYNIPLSTISEETVSFISKDRKVIVYCQSGNRSKIASSILADMGFTVYNMIDGIASWSHDIVTE